MSQLEAPCRICGVVFNIGRIRRKDEPVPSGWTAPGRKWHADPTRPFDPFGSEDEQSRTCQDEDGCYWIRRLLYFTDSWHSVNGVDALDDRGELFGDGDEDDLDYVDDGSSEYEEYEYESTDELVEQSSEEEQQEEEEGDDEDDANKAESGNSWRDFLLDDQAELWNYERSLEENQFSFLHKLNRLPRILPLNSPHILSGDDRVREHYEHIAGPTCQNRVGYNGHHITAEEMQDCNTFQFLVPRRHGWQAEPHDQSFESAREFDPIRDLQGFEDWSTWNETFPPPFISGLGNTTPGSLPTVLPARHGVRQIVEHDAMPFHPTCLDILQRLWKAQMKCPLDAYMLKRWCSPQVPEPNNWATPPGLKHHPDVHRSYGVRWNHIRGLEYLAANPLFIPRLELMLKSAVQENSSFSTNLGAFAILERDKKPQLTTSESQDPFKSLPEELGLRILFYLESRDVGNLRLASQAFRQIPIYFWRHLILKEMPWLWEAWSDDEPYLWATVPFAVLEKEEHQLKLITDQCEQYRKAIQIEMPEILDEWTAAEKRMLAARPDVLAECFVKGKEKLSARLPIDTTNWFQLYADIKKCWDDLKGLQNRKRIWGECERVIEYMMTGEFLARH